MYRDNVGSGHVNVNARRIEGRVVVLHESGFVKIMDPSIREAIFEFSPRPILLRQVATQGKTVHIAMPEEIGTI